jgi:hypothetical protein
MKSVRRYHIRGRKEHVFERIESMTSQYTKSSHRFSGPSIDCLWRDWLRFHQRKRKNGPNQGIRFPLCGVLTRSAYKPFSQDCAEDTFELERRIRSGERFVGKIGRSGRTRYPSHECLCEVVWAPTRTRTLRWRRAFAPPPIFFPLLRRINATPRQTFCREFPPDFRFRVSL